MQLVNNACEALLGEGVPRGLNGFKELFAFLSSCLNAGARPGDKARSMEVTLARPVMKGGGQRSGYVRE